MNCAIEPGQRILEAGIGSGSLTIALASTVAPTGMVISYDIREEFISHAMKNLTQAKLAKYVTTKIKDVTIGIEETNLDAIILDIPEPLGSSRPCMERAETRRIPLHLFPANLPGGTDRQNHRATPLHRVQNLREHPTGDDRLKTRHPPQLRDAGPHRVSDVRQEGQNPLKREPTPRQSPECFKSLFDIQRLNNNGGSCL